MAIDAFIDSIDRSDTERIIIKLYQPDPSRIAGQDSLVIIPLQEGAYELKVGDYVMGGSDGLYVNAFRSIYDGGLYQRLVTGECKEWNHEEHKKMYSRKKEG